jgi:regulator of cell morphogenesis and NO signaling
MKTSIDIDPAWSVNELLSRTPAAARVLNAFGIDTCCGGGDSLADAAREARLDLDVLLAALADATTEGTT